MADTNVANLPVADATTRSLRASANPQARMQELLKQDAPVPKSATETHTLPVAQTTTLPESSTTSSAATQMESSVETDADSSAVAKKRRQIDTQKPRSTGAQNARSITSGDPVRQAMLGMLALPYPDDMAEGAMTVTSVKIPKPVWERLEYARTLTKKDKQDIIADALRIYFELIVEGGLEK